MDAVPIAGATITLRYSLVPEFFPRQISGEIQNTTLNVRRDMQRGLTASGQTDTNGMVTATLDVEGTRAEVQSQVDELGHHPAAINAWLNVEFDTHGIHMTRADVLARVPLEDQSIQLPVDFGMSIVGHTTSNSARLWFRTTFTPTSGQSFFCRVSTDTSIASLRRRSGSMAQPGAFGGTDYPVQIKGSANTASIDVQLPTGSKHNYSLILKRGIQEAELTLLRGSLSTPTSNQQGVEFAFGSCHLPVNTAFPELATASAFRALNRWRELAERSGHEFLILMGDQIYGDDIETKFPRLASFEERYNARYAQLWGYRPTRQVMRSEPTYMILDDHEVKDDFGPGNIQDQRVTAGVDAYRVWQDSHNPDGPSGSGPPFHYHFRRGPAAFFVVDCRTSGGQAQGYPVFGARQRADFEAWASSEETLDADVIFLVAPIPPALVPVELLRSTVENVSATAASGVGALLGLGIGAAVGGPLGAGAGAVIGAAILGAIGYQVGEEVYQEWVDPWLLNDADLAERWDRDTNQPDLKILLDTLFNLANGIGEANPKKRAAFILAGDIHVGSAHSIVSLHSEHADNPVIYQLASSAISHPPVSTSGYRALVSTIRENPALAGFLAADIPTAPEPTDREDNLVPWTASGPNVEPNLLDVVVDAALGSSGPARFLLDPDAGSKYVANYHALIMERTVGYARVERVYPNRRVYRFGYEISGEQGDIVSTFDLDLDAQKIVPILGGAEFVALRWPSQVDRGQRFTIEVDVRNTGSETWTREYKCTVSSGPWPGRSVAVSGTISRGQAGTFIFHGALDNAGTYLVQFQMLDDDGTVMAASEPISISVSNSNVAACAELAGQHASASARLRTLQQASQSSGDPLGTIQKLITATAGEIAAIEARQGQLGC